MEQVEVRERVVQSSTDPSQKAYQKKKAIFRVHQVVWYILGVVEVLLANHDLIQIAQNVQNFSKLHVLIAEIHVKFHSVQQAANLYFVGTVLRINQRMIHVNLTPEVITLEVLIDHSKAIVRCLMLFAQTVVMHAKSHSVHHRDERFFAHDVLI